SALRNTPRSTPTPRASSARSTYPPPHATPATSWPSRAIPPARVTRCVSVPRAAGLVPTKSSFIARWPTTPAVLQAPAVRMPGPLRLPSGLLQISLWIAGTRLLALVAMIAGTYFHRPEPDAWHGREGTLVYRQVPYRA